MLPLACKNAGVCEMQKQLTRMPPVDQENSSTSSTILLKWRDMSTRHQLLWRGGKVTPLGIQPQVHHRQLARPQRSLARLQDREPRAPRRDMDQQSNVELQTPTLSGFDDSDSGAATESMQVDLATEDALLAEEPSRGGDSTSSATAP